MVLENLKPQIERLIVLLPESLAGNLSFARKIHWLAAKERKDVLYLTLLDDADNGLSISRRMATMKAVTESNLIRVGSVHVVSSRWMGKLREVLRPGDTVVCHEEQVVNAGFLKTIPLFVFLSKEIDAPIITVKGYYHPQRVEMGSWLRKFIFWLGALGILGGFSLIELLANDSLSGAVNKIVLTALIGIEFGAVWIWSRINRIS